MDLAFLVTLAVPAAAVVLVLVLVVLAVLLARASAARRGLRRDLDTALRQVDELATRVRELDETRDRTATPAASTAATRGGAGRPATEYVITSVGDLPARPQDQAPAAVTLSAGQFASVALGESLVRVLSFGHGVRRALSAENRNRIAFEMRREVRRSRKERRREVKEARRHLRAAARADLSEDAA